MCICVGFCFVGVCGCVSRWIRFDIIVAQWQMQPTVANDTPQQHVVVVGNNNGNNNHENNNNNNNK